MALPEGTLRASVAGAIVGASAAGLIRPTHRSALTGAGIGAAAILAAGVTGVQ